MSKLYYFCAKALFTFTSYVLVCCYTDKIEIGFTFHSSQIRTQKYFIYYSIPIGLNLRIRPTYLLPSKYNSDKPTFKNPSRLEAKVNNFSVSLLHPKRLAVFWSIGSLFLYLR